MTLDHLPIAYRRAFANNPAMAPVLAQRPSRRQRNLHRSHGVALKEQALRSAITLDDAALGQWANNLTTRIGLQSEMVWMGMNDGYQDAGGKDVAIPYLGLYWILGLAKKHCADCPAIAMGSPYDPPGKGSHVLDQTPGDGATGCGAGCKCWLEYGLPAVATPKDYAWSNGNFPGPGRATRVDGGVDRESPYGVDRAYGQRNYTWREAALLDPSSEHFTDGQQRALDFFRAKWYAWEDQRGSLPGAPEMFSTLDQTQNIGELETMWDSMSPQQRNTLLGMQEAIGMWNEATGEANDALASGDLGDGSDAASDDETALSERDDAVRLGLFSGFAGRVRGGMGGVGHGTDRSIHGAGGLFTGSRPGEGHEENAANIHEFLAAHHSGGGAGSGGRSERGGWPTSRAQFDHMVVDWRASRDAGWDRVVARDGHELTAESRIIVFHTTDQQTAEKLATSGFRSSDKPSNLARERYDAGEGAIFGPGRGAGSGLYVGMSPHETSGYGRHTVAIVTTVGRLRASPEQQALGSARVPMTGTLALLRNDAMLIGPIHHSQIHILTTDPNKMITYGEEWEALVASQQLSEEQDDESVKLWGFSFSRGFFPESAAGSARGHGSVGGGMIRTKNGERAPIRIGGKFHGSEKGGWAKKTFGGEGKGERGSRVMRSGRHGVDVTAKGTTENTRSLHGNRGKIEERVQAFAKMQKHTDAESPNRGATARARVVGGHRAGEHEVNVGATRRTATARATGAAAKGERDPKAMHIARADSQLRQLNKPTDAHEALAKLAGGDPAKLFQILRDEPTGVTEVMAREAGIYGLRPAGRTNAGADRIARAIAEHLGMAKQEGATKAAKPKLTEEQKISAKRETAIARAKTRLDAAHKSGDAKEQRLAQGALKRAQALPKNQQEHEAQVSAKAEAARLKQARATVKKAEPQTLEQRRAEAMAKATADDKYKFDPTKETADQYLQRMSIRSQYINGNKFADELLAQGGHSAQGAPVYSSPAIREQVHAFAVRSGEKPMIEHGNLIKGDGSLVAKEDLTGQVDEKTFFSPGGQSVSTPFQWGQLIPGVGLRGQVDMHSHPGLNADSFSHGWTGVHGTPGFNMMGDLHGGDWGHLAVYRPAMAVLTGRIGDHAIVRTLTPRKSWPSSGAVAKATKQALKDVQYDHYRNDTNGEQHYRDAMNQRIADLTNVEYRWEVIPHAFKPVEFHENKDGAIRLSDDDAIQLGIFSAIGRAFGGTGRGSRSTGGLGGRYKDGREVLRQGGKFNGSTKGTGKGEVSEREARAAMPKGFGRGSEHGQQHEHATSPNEGAARRGKSLNRSEEHPTGEKTQRVLKTSSDDHQARQTYEAQRAAYKQTHDDSPLGVKMPFTREEFIVAVSSGVRLKGGATADARLTTIAGERYVVKQIVGGGKGRRQDETSVESKYRQADSEVAGVEAARLVGLGGNVGEHSLVIHHNMDTYSVQSFARGTTLSSLSPRELAKFDEIMSGALGQRTMLFEYMVGRVDGHGGNYIMNSATNSVKLIDFGNDFTASHFFSPLQTMTGRAVLASHGGKASSGDNQRAHPAEMKNLRLDKGALHEIVSHTDAVKSMLTKFRFKSQSETDRRMEILRQLAALEQPTMHDLILLGGAQEVGDLVGGGTHYKGRGF